MNKLLTAIVAALMLAGGLSAVSGSTTMPFENAVTIVGEGSSPLPVALVPNSSSGELGSPVSQ